MFAQPASRASLSGSRAAALGCLAAPLRTCRLAASTWRRASARPTVGQPQKVHVAPPPELTIAQDPSPGIGIALDEIKPFAIEMFAWWQGAKAKGRQAV
jgi:hypothetical protein